MKPEVTEKAALKTVATNVAKGNIRDEYYGIRVKRDKTEKRKLTITPKLSEVSARKLLLILYFGDR